MTPGAPPQGAPGGQGGRGGFQLKNVQVLKDVPPDQWQMVMQYVAASLGEQIDYSDYRDVNGIKVPFTVRHSTWNAVTTERMTDVKINAPVADTIFTKPVPQQ